MGRILLIDDSIDCQTLVRHTLADSAELFVAPNLEKARAFLRAQDFDLLLVDVNLPDGDGFGFCSQLLAEKGSQRPRVLFLTGRKDLSDKLTGFSVGGDDYLAKPFEPLELKARVLAHLRQSREITLTARMLKAGNLRIDLSHHKAELQAAEGHLGLDFTPTEFKLVALLSRQEGRVFSRDELLAELFDGKTHVLDRTIDAHLSRIRKKLAGCTHTVESVYGMGYRLAPRAA